VDALCFASEFDTNLLDTFLRSCKKDFVVKSEAAVLFDAISNAELDTIKLLLRYGVDCNILIDVKEQTAIKRKTCLAAAIETLDREILKLIIDTGVNVSGVVEQDAEGQQTAFPRTYTALVKAIRCQNLSAVDLLLEAGAEVESYRNIWLTCRACPPSSGSRTRRPGSRSEGAGPRSECK